MKRLFPILTVCCLLLASEAPAQDPATEERLNKLAGQIEDLITAHKALQSDISGLSRRLDDLREQVGKPNVDYATHEDLKALADSIREVDRKRIQDAENIQKQLLTIQKLAASAPAPSVRKQEKTPQVDRPQKGFEYTVQPGDTLSSIIQACRDQNVKVTLDQVLKANPGLVPERMKVGQTIFIPAP